MLDAEFIRWFLIIVIGLMMVLSSTTQRRLRAGQEVDKRAREQFVNGR